MTTALPTGIVTPLVAFVTPSGEPDQQAMQALVDHEVSGGVDAVLVNGSMGELGNLTAATRRAMVRTVVHAAAGRVPVWAGVAGLGTPETAAAARDAEDEGANALLVLPPLFFDVSDSELHRHFATVSAAGVPVLAYDVPPRTPRKLPPDLVAAMAADGTIQGIKDSSGNLTAARTVCLLTSEITGFRAYVGTELAIDAAPALGFAGCVPGLANVLPAVAAAINTAARDGDAATAQKQQQIYLRLMTGLTQPWPGDASPVAVACGAFKAATAHVLGLPEPQTLAPMTPADQQARERVAQLVDSLTGR